MQPDLKYKIIRRNLKTGMFVVKLENGNRVLDDMAWVKFKPMVGDTGIIRDRGDGQPKMFPDAYDSE